MSEPSASLLKGSEFGSLAWGRATGGATTRRERLGLIGPLLGGAVTMMQSRILLMLGIHG